MAEQARAELDPVSVSFAAHVRAFHGTLPPEEQVLLEQIFRLAEAVTRQAGDTQGFAAEALPHLAGAGPDSMLQLGLLLPAILGPNTAPQRHP
jgi:hypothetical protein